MKITRTRKKRKNGIETLENYSLKDSDYMLIVPNSENEEGIFGRFNSQKRNDKNKIELYRLALRVGHLEFEGAKIPNIAINANYNITIENTENIYPN